MAEIKEAKLNDLIQDDRNLNKGTERGQQLIEKSLREFGAGRSVLIDKNNRIIAGNKTHQNASLAGLDDVIIVETDGTKLVAVKRTDVDLDTKKGREMALADNATVKVDLQWDTEELNAVAEDFGIDTDEWDVELDEMPVDLTEATEDDFDEEQDEVKPVAQRGDVFVLGEHRLMCGDSTDADAVAKLMNGERADCVFTDPPYGINLDGDYTGRGGRNLANFKDDSTQYAIKAFDIVQQMGVGIQVWFGANYYCHHLPETNNWLIWDKRGADGVENTNSDAELAWVKDGHDSCRVFRHLWMGMVKASEHGEKRIHPTQKPIALWSYCFERYAPDATICLDLFGGSGSTMIACEQLVRKCRMMELDPHYCDVIIARWEKLTGKKAVKVDGNNAPQPTEQ